MISVRAGVFRESHGEKLLDCILKRDFHAFTEEDCKCVSEELLCPTLVRAYVVKILTSDTTLQDLSCRPSTVANEFEIMEHVRVMLYSHVKPTERMTRSTRRSTPKTTETVVSETTDVESTFSRASLLWKTTAS